MRFRNNAHVLHVAQRIASSRSGAAWTSRARCWTRASPTAAGSMSSSPAQPQGPGHLDPQILAARCSTSRIWLAGTVSPAMGAGAGNRRPLPAQHHHFRRHRLGQDDLAQRVLQHDRPRRTHRHDRGRRRIAAAAGACRAAGDPARQHRGHRADRPARIWSRTRCACAPTGSSSARCRGAGSLRHDAGDEHRPRRLDVDRPRQFRPRRAGPYREHDHDGQRQPAEPGHPGPDRQCRRPDRRRPSACATACAASPRSSRSAGWRRTSSRSARCSSTNFQGENPDGTLRGCFEANADPPALSCANGLLRTWRTIFAMR